MKHLKIIMLIALFSTSVLTHAHAQKFEDGSYCTLTYWGRNIKLDRSFFEILNNNYAVFLNNTARSWKWYDLNDYNGIYIQDVENLKSPNFNIIVTEANQLLFSNPIGIMPGTDGEKDRSKKSIARAKWILYEVVLPSLQQFAKYK